MRRPPRTPRAPSRCSSGSSPIRRLHARFVNTLARLEYVGVRKILKSRRAERLDLDGLQHILDEAVHALRLKKAAAALGRRAASTSGTFADGATLAGDAGETYLQALDHRAEEALGDLPAAERARGELPASPAPPSRCARRSSTRSTTRLPAGARRRVLRRGDQQGRGPPPGRDGGRPRRRRCPTGARGSSRCSPPRRRSSRASWRAVEARSRTRRMAQFRTLSAGDVRGDPAALRRRRLSRRTSRSPVGTINTNVRVETDGGPLFLRINEGKSRGRRPARGGHRRPRRRARRPHAGAARHARPAQPFVALAGASSSRCFPGSPDGRSTRAELTPAHAAAVGAALGDAPPRERRLRRPPPRPLRARRDRPPPGAHRRARAAPSWRRPSPS